MQILQRVGIIQVGAVEQYLLARVRHPLAARERVARQRVNKQEDGPAEGDSGEADEGETAGHVAD
jgi:hypothetical protein